MWQLKPRLFILLAELVDLLREQNSLTRELIQAQTRRPARTPITKTSLAPLPAPRTSTISLSAKDVTTPQTRRRGPVDQPIPMPTTAEALFDELEAQAQTGQTAQQKPTQPGP